jgi:hypothetical protein
MNAASIATEPEPKADLLRYYPNFTPAEVPPGTSALHAWIGSMQPFEDDESSRLLLRALDENRPVEIDRGTLRAISYPEVSHAKEKLLAGMQVTFQLLLLEFPPPAHPRVYGLTPRISEYVFPAHPHLRRDQPIVYGGVSLPALCIYSAADFRYLKQTPQSVEFLDQAATFLAKHLIWIRTRQLFNIPTNKLIYSPSKGSLVLDFEPREEDNVSAVSRCIRRTTRVWKGYWPGKTAPAGVVAHIRTISPNFECWCGSGLLYKNCHLPIERWAR